MFMPSWRRKSLKNSKSAGGSTGSTTTVIGMPMHPGEPEAGPLPPAEVGQGEDRAPAGGRRTR